MLSPLTKEQRIKVEENMGLVGKVIRTAFIHWARGACSAMTTCSNRVPGAVQGGPNR